MNFSFNGHSAADYGIVLQRPISFSAAKPRVKSITVPGRNGDLHYYDGSFENRKATAVCYCLAESAAEQMATINNFLFSNFTTGYKKLETSDDPEHYWWAQVVSAGELDVKLGRANAFEIVFDCKPYRVDEDGGEVL